MDSHDIDALLDKLTLEEKVSLLAAVDWWRTPAIKRDDVFVPHLKTTNGPNGTRGESYVSGIKAACFPCGTSLGASFDRELLYRTGQEIAKEARTKAANVLLAPTLNVIRSPRGGRNYETYSEDPVVLGALAAAFINGCQSMGVAATPKHFVANETENDRKILSAEVDEQVLREIYMLPFQLLLKCYNRVNGTYVADDARLVNGVVRQEWGFDGVVVSDWMGVYSTADSTNAVVDIEMLGPTKWRGEKLLKAIADGSVAESTVRECARRVLVLAQRLGRFDNPEELPEFIVRAGAEGTVLLKNDGSLLSLSGKATIAVIGYHGTHAVIGGGGSARVDSIRAVRPVDGLREAGFNVIEADGVPVFGAVPHANSQLIYESATKTQPSAPVKIEWFNGHVIGQDLVFEETKVMPEYMIKEKWPSYLSEEYCTRITFDICSPTDGNHILSAIATGPAICYVNGEKVFTRPQETELNPESFYFFKSHLEQRFTYRFKAGKFYTLVLESWNTDLRLLHAPPLSGRMFQGSALRFHEAINLPQRIQDASEAAANADYAIVCIGTTPEIESEGFDRDSMALSQAQYDKVRAVAKNNPNTLVGGGPVDFIPIIDEITALIQAWFPGQEAGHSLAAVLSGAINPSGRLPFTWPRRDEENPSYNDFPCDENKIVRYKEGLNVGYRYYDRRDTPAPLFPFGFGLSYGTDFRIDKLGVSKSSFSEGNVLESVTVRCTVRNKGTKTGAVVLQYYVNVPDHTPTEGNTAVVPHKRPLKELKEFQKVKLGPGEEQEVSVTLDKYTVDAGRYTVCAGLSAAEIVAHVDFEIEKGFPGRGSRLSSQDAAHGEAGVGIDLELETCSQ
ncbi:glycoside hydrolase superfamily [Aspergillus heterothallicus]